MTVLEILRAARERIRTGWTQGAMARDAAQRRVQPEHPLACVWCAAGALFATTTPHEPPEDSEARGVAMGLLTVEAKAWDPRVASLEQNPLVVWNDRPGRTQAEVIGLFDAAIAAEGA